MRAMYFRVPRQLYGDAMFQEGVLTAAQLVGAGMSHEALSSLVRGGHWQRPHRGVYATFSGELSRDADLWAAVLAAGPDAMLSYESAAEVSKLADKPSALVHVTVPNSRRVKPIRGVVIHYSDRAEQARHPAGMPPRTLIEETVLDLAGEAAIVDDAVGWVTRALGRKLTSQDRIREAMALRRRMRWRTDLAELLSPDAEGMHSVLEVRYHRDVERPHRLPEGTRQAQFSVGSRRAFRDRFYEDYLTVVELDGRATHTVDKRWDDIRRDNATSAGGILTLRFGWLDVTKHPCQVAAEVARALANRGFTDARPCSRGCPVGKATGRYRSAGS
jgi:very-short-patch-repair endonuclease